MVPETDKAVTYAELKISHAQIETLRQQILALKLDEFHHEKQALAQLAIRSLQQARQWTGRMLGELGMAAYPYPNSQDATTNIIDPSVVPIVALPDDGLSTVQRIKAVRAAVKALDGQLEDKTSQLIPGSRFNQFLFLTQEHLLQAGMWLGELLAEHFNEQPVATPTISEPPVPLD
jgi:hypothetical protein